MTKKEKLIKRFCSAPADFTWAEFLALIKYYGFEEVSKGKTSGSRKAFINSSTKQIIRLHQPHPGNILKKYQIEDVREILGI